MNKFRIKKIIDNWDIGIFYLLALSVTLAGISNILYWTVVQRQMENQGVTLYVKLIKYVTIMEVSYTACDIDVQARRVLVVEDNNSRRSLLTQSLKAEPIPLKGEKWSLKADGFGGFALDHKIQLEAKPPKREQIWYTIGDASHP